MPKSDKKKSSLQKRKEITDAIRYSTRGELSQTSFQRQVIKKAKTDNNYIISDRVYKNNRSSFKYIKHNIPSYYDLKIAETNTGKNPLRFAKGRGDEFIEIRGYSYYEDAGQIVRTQEVSSRKRKSIKEAISELKQEISEKKEYYHVTYGIDLKRFNLYVIVISSDGRKVITE